MWNGIWNKIKTKSVTPYKSHPKAIKNDMVDIVLTMPSEVYSVFRVQLDAPHTLRSRRVSDNKRGDDVTPTQV